MLTGTWITYIVLCVVLTILNLAGVVLPTNSIIVTLVFSAGVTFAFYRDLRRRVESKWMRWILMGGEILRIALLFFDIHGRAYGHLLFSGGDTEMFYQSGMQMAELGPSALTIREPYISVVAITFMLFGIQRSVLQMLNVILALQSVLILIEIFKHLGRREWEHYAAVTIMTYFPTFLMISVALLRDTLVLFFVTLSFYCYLQWWMDGTKRALIFTLIALAGGMLFHIGAGAIGVGYLIGLMFYKPKEEKFLWSIRTWIILGILCLIVVIAAFNLTSILHGKLAIFKYDGFSGALKILNESDKGNSGYFTGIYLENPALNLLLNTPTRIIGFLCSPLPWDWHGLGSAVAFLCSSVPYMVMLLSSIFRFRHLKKSDRLLTIILWVGIFVALVIFGWSTNNAGTALRHRDKFLSIYLILYSLSAGWNRKRYIRLDDASDYRDMEKWDQMERLLDQYGVKPIIGIIPENHDPELTVYPKDFSFWERVDSWKEKGYTLALHGYHHVYTTQEGGINPVNSVSEFAGVSRERQEEMLSLGVTLLESHGVHPWLFFAPAHTFDENTVTALVDQTPIRWISDTVAMKPYQVGKMNYLPQQSGRVRVLPFYSTTFCYHPNEMEEEDFLCLEKFLKRYSFSDASEWEHQNAENKRTVIDKILSSLYLKRNRK